MKKVKLPRRRKKAYIKTNGRQNYYSNQIIGEILCEKDDTKKNRSFPQYGNPVWIGRRPNILFYW